MRQFILTLTSKLTSMLSRESIKEVALIAQFAALIAVASIFVIPIGVVPVTLQTMMIALTGLLIGPRAGVMAVGLYILAGTVGIPVFAGGKAGLGVLMGPSSGYLFGFLGMVFLAGLAKNKPVILGALLLLLGIVFDHCCGIAGMSVTLKKTLMQAAAIDMAFIPGDLIKAAIAFAVYLVVRRRQGSA